MRTACNVWRVATSADIALQTVAPGANAPALGSNYPGTGGATPGAWLQIKDDTGTVWRVPSWP